MSRTKPALADLPALQERYKTFIDRLRERWVRANNRPPQAWTLYELDPEEQQRVRDMIRRWEEYITPIAESWWGRYGIGIRWPQKSTDPCKFYWLEDAAA